MNSLEQEPCKDPGTKLFTWEIWEIVVRKQERETRKEGHLTGQLPVQNPEFHGKISSNSAKHSFRIISSEDEGADIFICQPERVNWVKAAREKGALVPQD